MARTDPSQLIQLAQSLARQAPAQAQMPDYGADIGSINRDYALADALAQQQYIPDSGWLGALAQIASAGAGAWKASKADKRAAELTKRMNADAQSAQQAEAERQAAARAQQIQQIAEAYKIDPQQAAVVADGLGKAADFKAPVSTSKLQYKDGVVFNPETGEVSKTDFYRAPGSGKAPAKPSLLTEAEQIEAARIKAGLAPRATAGKGPGGMTKDERTAANKQREAQTALAILDEMEKIVGATGPLDQFIPGEAQSRFQALQAQALNAYKGATRGPGEGTFTEGDAALLRSALPQLGRRQEVNVQTINDLRAQLAPIAGKNAAEPAAPSGAPKPGHVENGYRYKGGDPADPASWEKV